MFKLPSGVYRIFVVYHDGKDQMIDNYAVWPGSHTSLNLIALTMNPAGIIITKSDI